MKNQKYLCLCLTFMMTAIFCRRHLPFLSVMNPLSSPAQVVIDIGHGGDDPGKVGINQAKEKDINLEIGHYLYRFLTSAGYTVAMTRDKDISLAAPGASNQKISDLNRRKEIMRQASPMAVVSIHQNSYPAEPQHGSQVFYPAGSTESKLLASTIQEHCRRILDPENTRQIKDNTDYYLFKDNPFPTVIVECGFLSNYREANLLITPEYQEKTAWAIYLGIVQYLKTLE